MNATPGKGVIVKPDGPVINPGPGIFSQLFIGFFWYYLACGCIYPAITWMWETKKTIALLIAIPSAVYMINQPLAVIFMKYFPNKYPGPWEDWFCGHLMVLLIELSIIALFNCMQEAGKKELERRRIAGKG